MTNTTWNSADKSAGITLSGSDLIAKNTNNATAGVRGVHRQTTGKYYWEYTLNAFTFVGNGVGIATASVPVSTGPSTVISSTATLRQSGGAVYVDGNATAFSLGTPSAGDVICVALDADARNIWFRKGAAGNWNGSASANPATGVGGASIASSALVAVYPWAVLANINDQVTANFGDTAFTGTVPSGFTSGFPNTVPSLDAIVTQIAAEHWSSRSALNTSAVLSQLAVEHWSVRAPAGSTRPTSPYVSIIT